MDNNTVYEWLLQTTFTVSARVKSLEIIEPYLASIVRPGDKVLDLCCGSGPASFWFEEQGCIVTAIDFAPYMIELAKGEKSRRRSTVEFIQADIFTYNLVQARYDLVSCFGNSLRDFPISNFARLAKSVFKSLKPGGRFILEYHDGSYEHMQRSFAYEGVYQESPERISYRFQEYLPEIGGYVKLIRNETRREEYKRTGYIYTVPVVQLIMGSVLALDQHTILAKNHFLDIFIKGGDT